MEIAGTLRVTLYIFLGDEREVSIHGIFRQTER